MADRNRKTPAKTSGNRKTRAPRGKTRPNAESQDPDDPVLPGVNPVVDDHLTPKQSLPFPIVAIGASAGGLEAFMALLGTLPADTGMAFVVVQHLSPTYQSVLSRILNRATAMPVAEVSDNMPVHPNRVYVIPPGKNLVFGDGHLQLAPRTERGQHRPIDHFMRSLAEEHGHKSIGIVLSGTANDGSLGIQEIKAAGGITFAQDNSAENEFLALLAHELRNPLAGIRNSSRLLSETHDESIYARAREIIDRQTTHMVRMIDDLLEASRVTQGKIRVRLERISLQETLGRSIESTDAERTQRHQELRVSLPNATTWVDGDPIRLEQVFVNLLHNATKFTAEEGTVWLTLAVEGKPDAPDGFAVVRVRDNGTGIDPAALDHIFDLFVQGDRRSARGRSGLGIGLTLAKRLIEMHGGTIEAFSQGSNQGSEFVVRLPLKSPPTKAPAKRGDGAKATSVASTANARRRVLIIDDDADGAETMRLLLENSGHEVEVSPDGERGIDRANCLEPDVVLVDIGLPTMDGYEVVRALRQRPETRRSLIIAVTGFGAESDVRKGREAGFDDHMTKPVNLDALRARLDDLD